MMNYSRTNWIVWIVPHESYADIRERLCSVGWPHIASEEYLDDECMIILRSGIKEDVCKGIPHVLNEEPINLNDVINEIITCDASAVTCNMPILQRRMNLRREMVNCEDKTLIGRHAMESSVPPTQLSVLKEYCNAQYLERLKRCLPERASMVHYMPKFDHPLCRSLLRHIRDEYKSNIDRFKCILIVGSSRIGKSYFVREHLVNPKYCITHSNELEFSKIANQPKKIFRILDDINWNRVDDMTLKCMINGTTAAVDVKYGTEYLFPLINIILMNKENYVQFRKKMVDIWEFIEKNMVIYPEQPKDGDVTEEISPLYTHEVIPEDSPMPYLFDEIIPDKILQTLDGKNMNEEVHKYLIEHEGWIYNGSYERYPESKKSVYIGNPSLREKDINEKYKEWILRQREKRIAEEPCVTKNANSRDGLKRGGSEKPDASVQSELSDDISDDDDPPRSRHSDLSSGEGDNGSYSDDSESDCVDMRSVEL